MKYVTFDGKTVLTSPAVKQLELGSAGTIEFNVKAGTATAMAVDCVLANCKDTLLNIRYGVGISSDRKKLIFWNPQQQEVAFDFSDGKPHQVAIVSEKKKTEVIIDGKSIGSIDGTYGDTVGLPLNIGSTTGKKNTEGSLEQGFVGELSGLRIWSKALSAEELKPLNGKDNSTSGAEFLGNPDLAAYLNESTKTIVTPFLPKPGPWIQDIKANIEQFQPAKTGTGGGDDNLHSKYERIPYFAFDRDPATGSTVIMGEITPTFEIGILTLVADPTTPNTYSFKERAGSKISFSDEATFVVDSISESSLVTGGIYVRVPRCCRCAAKLW